MTHLQERCELGAAPEHARPKELVLRLQLALHVLCLWEQQQEWQLSQEVSHQLVEQ
jgi:hypothetical protein